MGNQHQKKTDTARQKPSHRKTAHNESISQTPATMVALSPATIMRLQRTIGNQAVQRLLARTQLHSSQDSGDLLRKEHRSPTKSRTSEASRNLVAVTPLSAGAGGSTLQKDGKTKKSRPKIKWSEVISELDHVKKASNARLVKAHDYMDEGLKTADATKEKLDTAAGHYEQAYDNYERIINKAKKKASSKEGLLNTFVGIGVGVALGMVASAMVPVSAGVGVRLLVEFLTEVGEAGSMAGLGKLTSQSVDSLKPAGMHPMALRAKHYEELVKLYRGMAITGKDALGQALLLTKITELVGQARLLEAGAKADMKPDDVVSQTSRLKPLVEPIYYPVGSIESLKEALARRMVPTVRELEQYLWVQWISTFGHYEESLDRYIFGNTDVLDNDTIEGYLHGDIDVLGDGSLLDVDFGRYTSEDDEEEAVIAANDKWGQIVGKYRDVL